MPKWRHSTRIVAEMSRPPWLADRELRRVSHAALVRRRIIAPRPVSTPLDAMHPEPICDNLAVGSAAARSNTFTVRRVTVRGCRRENINGRVCGRPLPSYRASDRVVRVVLSQRRGVPNGPSPGPISAVTSPHAANQHPSHWKRWDCSRSHRQGSLPTSTKALRLGPHETRLRRIFFRSYRVCFVTQIQSLDPYHFGKSCPYFGWFDDPGVLYSGICCVNDALKVVRVSSSRPR